MAIEVVGDVVARARKYAALAEPSRLAIIDLLSLGDAAPSELQRALNIPSNLLAHHLKILGNAGFVKRTRSEADRRRTYLGLVPGSCDALQVGRAPVRAPRIVFVCTANSARSQLAAAMWRRASAVPATSAGTHPVREIDPGALAAAHRHALPLRRQKPRALDQVMADGDLIVTVCDHAHEELNGESAVHWSVPDPVPIGTETAFDAAYEELARRVNGFAPHLHAC